MRERIVVTPGSDFNELISNTVIQVVGESSIIHQTGQFDKFIESVLLNISERLYEGIIDSNHYVARPSMSHIAKEMLDHATDMLKQYDNEDPVIVKAATLLDWNTELEALSTALRSMVETIGTAYIEALAGKYITLMMYYSPATIYLVGLNMIVMER